MSVTIRVWDEVIPGPRTSPHLVTIPGPRATVRDLLRSRVKQEVDRFNQSLPEVFQGLVQPEESEQILNGFRLKVRRPLNWEAQFERACKSFDHNGFLLLVDGHQVAALDEPIDLRDDSDVQFIKLVPLVGG